MIELKRKFTQRGRYPDCVAVRPPSNPVDGESACVDVEREIQARLAKIPVDHANRPLATIDAAASGQWTLEYNGWWQGRLTFRHPQSARMFIRTLRATEGPVRQDEN